MCDKTRLSKNFNFTKRSTIGTLCQTNMSLININKVFLCDKNFKQTKLISKKKFTSNSSGIIKFIFLISLFFFLFAILYINACNFVYKFYFMHRLYIYYSYSYMVLLSWLESPVHILMSQWLYVCAQKWIPIKLDFFII